MSEETDGGAPPLPLAPREAIAAMAVHAPSERNRKLAGLLGAANASAKLKAARRPPSLAHDPVLGEAGARRGGEPDRSECPLKSSGA